jgi:putative acetyltransferase
LFVIRKLTGADYEEFLRIWEASVRATHRFLREEDIVHIRAMIVPDLLALVEVYGRFDAPGNLMGFVGVADRKLEMLFIDPPYFRQGLGRELLRFAEQHLAADHLDVNEQNPGATGFYQSMGYVVVGRSEKDGQGQAFPLLHMEKRRRVEL